MIIIMKESASAKEIKSVEKLLAEFGFQTHPIQGEKKTVIGAIGEQASFKYESNSYYGRC